MAIATYSDLKSAVADWLNRSDLTAVIPSFITLAEAQFNKDERLRTRESMVRSTATFNGQYESLPSDYLEMANLQINDLQPFGKMQFISLNQIDGYKDAYSTNGVPKYYTIVGNQIELLPTPGQDYTAEMVYYAKIAALSDTNTTNWLLTKHPDVYLYGTLIQSAPYLKDDDRMATWMNLYERGVGDVEVADERALFAGSVIKVRTKAF
jgi:hypothetical protein